MHDRSTEEKADEMRLLVGLDGRSGGHDALELARVLASASGGSITAVTDLYGGTLPMEYARLRDAEVEGAEVIFEEAREKVPAEFETRAYGGGTPAAILTTDAERGEFDAIVVGSPHRGAIGRVLLGSAASSLLNGSPCDVLVAPRGYADTRHEPYRSIAVAYDGSPESKVALSRAVEIARLSNASIRVLTVVSPPAIVAVPGGAPAGYIEQSPPEPDQVINEATASIGPVLKARGVRLDGAPGTEIRRACEEDTDLLVIGSRGYGPLARVLLGSVSRQLVNETPCPVLVARRPE